MKTTDRLRDLFYKITKAKDFEGLKKLNEQWQEDYDNEVSNEAEEGQEEQDRASNG